MPARRFRVHLTTMEQLKPPLCISVTLFPGCPGDGKFGQSNCFRVNFHWLHSIWPTCQGMQHPCDPLFRRPVLPIPRPQRATEPGIGGDCQYPRLQLSAEGLGSHSSISQILSANAVIPSPKPPASLKLQPKSPMQIGDSHPMGEETHRLRLAWQQCTEAQNVQRNMFVAYEFRFGNRACRGRSAVPSDLPVQMDWFFTSRRRRLFGQNCGSTPRRRISLRRHRLHRNGSEQISRINSRLLLWKMPHYLPAQPLFARRSITRTVEGDRLPANGTIGISRYRKLQSTNAATRARSAASGTRGTFGTPKKISAQVISTLSSIQTNAVIAEPIAVSIHAFDHKNETHDPRIIRPKYHPRTSR